MSFDIKRILYLFRRFENKSEIFCLFFNLGRILVDGRIDRLNDICMYICMYLFVINKKSLNIAILFNEIP